MNVFIFSVIIICISYSYKGGVIMFIPIFLIVVGLFAIICTVLKPAFYWESRKATRLIKLIGSTATSILYITIGILLVGIGVADLFGLISL